MCLCTKLQFPQSMIQYMTRLTDKWCSSCSPCPPCSSWERRWSRWRGSALAESHRKCCCYGLQSEMHCRMMESTYYCRHGKFGSTYGCCEQGEREGKWGRWRNKKCLVMEIARVLTSCLGTPRPQYRQSRARSTAGLAWSSRQGTGWWG